MTAVSVSLYLAGGSAAISALVHSNLKIRIPPQLHKSSSPPRRLQNSNLPLPLLFKARGDLGGSVMVGKRLWSQLDRYRVPSNSQMPKPIKLANSCTFPAGNASSELLELDSYLSCLCCIYYKRFHLYPEPCILCLVPCALCLAHCASLLFPCPIKPFSWTGLLALIVVMAVVIDCQYCAIHIIPSTVLPKPNRILAHPLNTSPTVQSKEAVMKVDFATCTYSSAGP